MVTQKDKSGQIYNTELNPNNQILLSLITFKFQEVFMFTKTALILEFLLVPIRLFFSFNQTNDILNCPYNFLSLEIRPNIII